jgi:hypothetical protein
MRESLMQGFLVENKVVIPQASVGIAVFPDHSDDPDSLLKHADSGRREWPHRADWQLGVRASMSTDEDLGAHASQHCCVSKCFAGSVRSLGSTRPDCCIACAHRREST